MQRHADAPASWLARLVQHHRSLVLAALFGFGVAGLTAAQLVRYLIGSGIAYNRGDVATVDIRAPYRLTFISEVETNRQRDLAEASVAPIFTPPDVHIARRQLSTALALLDRIRVLRSEPDLSEAERLARLRTVELLDALPENIALTILRLNDAQWGRVASQVLSVLDTVLRTPIHPDNLDKVRAGLGQYISLSLSPEEAEVVYQLASALLVTNTNYDAAATAAARRAARESVKPVERTYEANQIIVRSGQIIGALEAEALEKFNLRRPTLSEVAVISTALISAVAMLSFLRAATHSTSPTAPLRALGLSVGLIVGAVALARWLLPGHGVLPFLTPLSAVALVIATWTGTLAGLVAAALVGVLVGMGLEKPLEMALTFATSGAVAVLLLGRAERLGHVLRAGAFAGAVQAVMVLALGLPLAHAEGWALLATRALVSLVGGGVAAGLALAALFLAGMMFDLLSVVQLTELSRLSHPLLREMVVRAPGTYHHSLMVANLAEQAAERIGADALLTRVGAYFHDIGKLANPHFFIENQLEGVNPHDQLDPYTSSAILRQHVTEGLRLAARYRLPRRLRDFIAEHHGTTVTSYQYAAALRSGNVDPEAFRYPGPRPRSKETALVMLADGTEAAVRAARCTSVEEMEAVIQRVFAERLADHQLDESPLTLRDLEVIRHSFLETLRGTYHPRLQYPSLGGATRAALPEAAEEWATP
ncbi:MAG: HDIG domain-containing protein [Anaerolineae bacterium]|nr:HDIG domain-containing protein [Anaerolineae bacterium]